VATTKTGFCVFSDPSKRQHRDVLAVDMFSGNVQEFMLLLAVESGSPVGIDGNG
jgi:hypothetical protein